MDDYSVAHIKDLKYKGFHPIEKKKTIEKINLLIDKYNRFCYDTFSGNTKYDKKSLAIVSANDKEVERILKKHGLDIYFQMGLSFIHDAKYNIYPRILNVEKDFKEKFIKESLNPLIKQKRDLKTINNEIEKDKFWQIYTYKGNKLSRNQEKFDELQQQVSNEYKKIVQEGHSQMVQVFKNYITDKQENKLEELKDFLLSTAIDLEREIYKDNTLKKEMKKVVETLKKIQQIVKYKKGNISSNEAKLLISCLKGLRGLEELIKINVSTLKEKYFLPTIKSDNKTKKIIFILISVLTDSPNKRAFKDTIVRNVRQHIKNPTANKKTVSIAKVKHENVVKMNSSVRHRLAEIKANKIHS